MPKVNLVVSLITTIVLLGSTFVAGQICNGDRCGCYKGFCWRYVDPIVQGYGNWWCYSQEFGVVEKKSTWARCSAHSECDLQMTCGNCTAFIGQEETSSEMLCQATPESVAPSTKCNGETCGCYKGRCWRYAIVSKLQGGNWWCYTEKPENNELGQCEQNNDCEFEMECSTCTTFIGHEEARTDDVLCPTVPTTTDVQTTMTPLMPCSGYECGCYQDQCWRYIDKDKIGHGQWWCYTQAIQRSENQTWSKCRSDNDCYWDMQCGNCTTFTGYDKTRSENILCMESPIYTTCNGSTCGCHNDKCWRYIEQSGDWWCYTNRSESDFATCSNDDECHMEMTCGNCIGYLGNEQVQRDTCTNSTAGIETNPWANSTMCNGVQCGCGATGFCWKYTEGTSWCYTKFNQGLCWKHEDCLAEMICVS